MANAFTKAEQVFFDDVLEFAESNLVVSRNAKKHRQNEQAMQQSGLEYRRPTQQYARVTRGLDTTGTSVDITNLTIPTGLGDSDIKNHKFGLNGLELNNPDLRKNSAQAAMRALAAEIEVETLSKVAGQGSLVATRTGDFTNYDDLSVGEVMLAEREISTMDPRTLALNPRMSRAMANELAARQTDNKRDMGAYERSLLPSVGGFITVKTGVQQSLSASVGDTVTVNGADQYKVPTEYDSSAQTPGSRDAADNRFSTLTVAATVLPAIGDAFTIAGVNAINLVSKQDTGQLQTFRVAGISGNDLTITPAIIPLDQTGDAVQQYANVTATPANSAALTFLNTNTAAPSIFYMNDAVEIQYGGLAMSEDPAGYAVKRETLSNGFELIFAKSGSIDNLGQNYRLTTWTRTEVLDNQCCGIYLPNQAADFG